MMKKEEAEKELAKAKQPDWEARLLERSRDLPDGPLRKIAENLAKDRTCGPRFMHKSAAHRVSDLLLPMSREERIAVLGVYQPTLAPAIADAWEMLSRFPCEGDFCKGYRAPRDPDLVASTRGSFLDAVLHATAGYDRDAAWYAAWLPWIQLDHPLARYMGSDSRLALVLSAAIDAGGPKGDEVLETLIASASGRHEIGQMGHHVTRALLSCSRPEAWEFMEKMLLAAQREEGLRQSILEMADEGNLEAFHRMLRLILDENLLRFSAVVRAADVWFGYAYDSASPAPLKRGIERFVSFHDDPAARARALASGDGDDVHLALRSLAYEDAPASLAPAAALLGDPDPKRRFAAAHHLAGLDMMEAKLALLTRLEDEELHVVQLALGACDAVKDSELAARGGLAPTRSDIALTMASVFSGPGHAVLQELAREVAGEPDAEAILGRFFADPSGMGSAETAGDEGASRPEAASEPAEPPQTVKSPPPDDIFDRLVRLLPRYPSKETELPPLLWPWRRPKVSREDVIRRLLRRRGDRPFEILLPYIHEASSWTRASFLGDVMIKQPWSPSVRRFIFQCAGDGVEDVRTRAFAGLKKHKIEPTDDETRELERLLSRKAPDLRKEATEALIRLPDDEAMRSAGRLVADKDAQRRMAGVEILREMVRTERKADACRELLAGAGDRAATEEESRRIKAAADKPEVVLNFVDCLGLIDPSDRTWPEPPRALDVNLDMSAAVRVLEGMDAFFTENAARVVRVPKVVWFQPILEGDDSTLDDDSLPEKPRKKADEPEFEEMPLGEVRNLPRGGEDPEAAFRRLPLAEEFRTWWDARDTSMRDADGLEIVRANFILAQPFGRWADASSRKPWARYPHIKAIDELKYGILVRGYAWMLFLSTPGKMRRDYLLDALETDLAHETPPAPRLGNLHPIVMWTNMMMWGSAPLSPGKLRLEMSRDQFARYWGLLRWLDDGHKGLEQLKSSPPGPNRQRWSPAFNLLLEFREAGIATDADVIDALAGYGRGGTMDLQNVSSRGGLARFKRPWLEPIVDRIRDRVLEIELDRGEAETPVTHLAIQLREVRGVATLARLLQARGADSFERGYHYWGGDRTRKSVVSHLVRACVPAEGETAESFVEAMKRAKIPDKTLIETAIYAPQWAGFVERKLGVPMFAEAVWWLHAHTKGSDWAVPEEFQKTWKAEVARRTPLSAEDLRQGAADVEWFGRVRAGLDDAMWKKLEAAAKYASTAAGHVRATLFAQAMSGRLDPAELTKRIVEKRHQDSVRALGLLPVTDGRLGAEVLERYHVLHEFLRTSRQFGAQRRASEKLAAEIGLANLARSAGYADPMRLQWAMEARALADLASGVISVVEGDVKVVLRIDDLGRPEIEVEKAGKPLKEVPAKLKKAESIKALLERKAELKKQVSRMRSSLEEAMVRGDTIVGSEVRELAAHAMLARMLEGTVLVGADDPSIAGWPIEGGAALETVGDAGDGRTVAYGRRPISDDDRFRVAHPHDLYSGGRWHLWQRDCFLRERIQPFKQVFRELYPLTDQERADGEVSRRYSGQQVHPSQAQALLGRRMWITHPDEGTTGRTFHEAGVTAWLDSEMLWGTPGEVEGLTIEGVRFSRKGEWGTMPLKDVPPRVFSEAMRDLDLVVSVAHRGGVDPEASASTVEMRSALLEETLAVLKIANVKLEKNHAIIEGERARYSLHLGSGVVHLLPGGALCIVPVHAQHRGRLFLPFADDDPKTAEVISKTLMLARDRDIKDPGILDQIRARG